LAGIAAAFVWHEKTGVGVQVGGKLIVEMGPGEMAGFLVWRFFWRGYGEREKGKKTRRELDMDRSSGSDRMGVSVAGFGASLGKLAF
jgi:hypothetical protein